MRYHKDVYIPDNDIKKLNAYTDILNGMNWRYTSHCVDNIKFRVIRLEDVLTFIKNLKLNASDIFEYVTDEKALIIKACYRVKYTQTMDLILIIGQQKNIITIYLNTADDKHETLDKNLYVRITKI